MYQARITRNNADLNRLLIREIRVIRAYKKVFKGFCPHGFDFQRGIFFLYCS